MLVGLIPFILLIFLPDGVGTKWKRCVMVFCYDNLNIKSTLFVSRLKTSIVFFLGRLYKERQRADLVCLFQFHTRLFSGVRCGTLSSYNWFEFEWFGVTRYTYTEATNWSKWFIIEFVELLDDRVIQLCSTSKYGVCVWSINNLILTGRLLCYIARL